MAKDTGLIQSAFVSRNTGMHYFFTSTGIRIFDSKTSTFVEIPADKVDAYRDELSQVGRKYSNFLEQTNDSETSEGTGGDGLQKDGAQ